MSRFSKKKKLIIKKPDKNDFDEREIKDSDVFVRDAEIIAFWAVI